MSARSCSPIWKTEQQRLPVLSPTVPRPDFCAPPESRKALMVGHYVEVRISYCDLQGTLAEVREADEQGVWVTPLLQQDRRIYFLHSEVAYYNPDPAESWYFRRRGHLLFLIWRGRSVGHGELSEKLRTALRVRASRIESERLVEERRLYERLGVYRPMPLSVWKGGV